MGEARYFSTKFAVLIMGVRYIPSVCYRLDETILPTVEKLVGNGEAKIYSEKVRFVNGVALPVKKTEERAASMRAVTETPAVTEAAKKPAGRRNKRSFD